MIRLIETRNYRCLRYIHRPLDNFQILVGPNASGKTTFLDVIGFISDIVNKGVDKAITDRSSNFTDLTFAGLGGSIELAIEASLPDHISQMLAEEHYDAIRYEVRIGLHAVTQEHEINEERVILLSSIHQEISNGEVRLLFPDAEAHPVSVLNQKYKKGASRLVIKKRPEGNDNFYTETTKDSNRNGGWLPSFKLGIKRSALGNLPADETRFPASTWLREYLLDGIQLFILDSLNVRKASPPGQGKKFKTDGSNLPWVIEDLKRYPKKFEQWIAHLQTALPDIKTIDTVEREDDKHRYLRILYENDIRVPSWLASDGTLRLLALTLPAYLPGFSGVYLIEEPENGIHPKAIESVYQSLSSVYSAQILLATHSPVILSLIQPADVLCFAKTEQGVTDIVSGSEHPLLRDWKWEINLSVLYAGGILG